MSDDRDCVEFAEAINDALGGNSRPYQRPYLTNAPERPQARATMADIAAVAGMLRRLEPEPVRHFRMTMAEFADSLARNGFVIGGITGREVVRSGIPDFGVPDEASGLSCLEIHLPGDGPWVVVGTSQQLAEYRHSLARTVAPAGILGDEEGR